MRLALALCCLASPLAAGVAEAVDDHILPAFDAFVGDTQALSEAAQADCTAEAVKPAYQRAFDGWMGIAHLNFGPLEADGRALAIAFWPDKRGIVAKTVAALQGDEDAAVNDPATFAEVSVAGRGLFALERLLYETDYTAGDYACHYVQAVSADLARMGAEMRAGWVEHAGLLTTAGDNATYLTGREAASTLYTALLAGLEFTADQRLGRPLGTFDRPRPERAEAWRSDRPLRNVVLSLEATRGLARTLADGAIPVTETAYDEALRLAADLDDPLFAGVGDPAGRLKVEILQQHIRALRTAIAAEIGAGLGLSEGFNSADGD
ncbi:imelysin family protein [Ponticoccus gilvus]|nr:imelysin family protein [Enemella evansiae]